MEKFPHLKFSERLVGPANFKVGGNINPTSEENKKNRGRHCEDLLKNSFAINSEWGKHISQRQSLNLAPLEKNIQPIFIQFNPDLVAEVDFNLTKFGIEIISEEDDGYIVGASLDSLKSLENKIRGFSKTERGSAKVADLWRIIDGDRAEWKPPRILSPDLLTKWASIEENEIYEVEVSIAFDKPIGKEPDNTKKGGKTRLKKFKDKLNERDTLLEKRQTDFQEFIGFYKATFKSSIIELEDSFGCQISICGKGLKDLVVNYPFVFEVNEVEEIERMDDIETGTVDFNFEIMPPEDEAPEVGIIDSGIMEYHRFLEPAIIHENSKSYLSNDTTTNDLVKNGGHGTKVAGAVLYPNGISHIQGKYQLPCFIRNLRVLDRNNLLKHKNPAELVQKIVSENSECRVFNLSINSTVPFRVKHMSLWAAMLDKLIHEKNVLFIASAGNILRDNIRHYFNIKKPYPEYLEEQACRLANPAQSSFAIVVGSVNHLSLDNAYWQSIGNKDDIAPYSRIGTGIWGHIKPDVVEYGGGMQISKNGINLINTKETGIELVRSTLNGGKAFDKESSGTSFAAPKVAHIIAELLKIYKDENINLLRALLAQGARLPKDFFQNPTVSSIKYFGYGIPSLKRVTKNTEHRITFYNTNSITAKEAQLYSLKLPQEIRGQGDDFEILLEVTLAYTAKIRRTRQRTKSYLSTWLEWKSSNLNDSFEDFRQRTFSQMKDGVSDGLESNIADRIKWKIRERENWGTVRGINRNYSTLQKDWAILKSYELPEELLFAVIAHKGWDMNNEPVPYAIVVSIEILGAEIPIYDAIKIENEVEISV
ncbi:MAG: S8 family peptidase [Ignavibacteriales bacterium]|nr:MAG: S8 family serine peptidase [Ignavibacteriaceae bacterium]MBW7873234.1 S8 family serine peptidase [Ignavibacteria bacterium]MCZ2142876.1 S8 family peptidase [Ignavibacteriales bacterium]OQY70998.1 MAG: peptidase [Ignavibacteriales bacterium UTCHB3]MBV6443970.1 hypothetical protein [Ignavibacteriaceae bacterium]